MQIMLRTDADAPATWDVGDYSMLPEIVAGCRAGHLLKPGVEQRRGRWYTVKRCAYCAYQEEQANPAVTREKGRHAG